MNRQYRFLLVVCGLICVFALALWPGGWLPPSRANVTLVSFTATSLPDQPEIYIKWETATQYNTIGFFVTRSDSTDGTYTRVSEFIVREGDDLTGAEYDWTDEDTTLNQAYWYKLEEITTNQQSEFYGPITAVAGVLATVEPTATPTPTPTATFTPSPTTTPTKQSNSAAVNPTTSSSGIVVATPRPATGATITPRPTSSGSSSSAAVAAATSVPPSNVSESQPQPLPVATTAPVMPDVPAATVAAPAVAMADVAQAPAFAPTATAPEMAVPAVVVTEVAPAAHPADSASTPALLLIGAAFLFLGIAFVILRQVRQ